MGFIARMIFGLFDRIWFFASIIIGAQWAGYIQAYIHQLIGHLDEAARWMREYKAIAEKHHHNLDNLVRSLQNSKDPSLIEQGELLKSHILREGQLQNTLDSIQNAEIWQQPFYFIKNLEYDIAMQTASNYIPTLPLSTDALISACVAVIVLWLPIKLILMLFSPRRNRQVYTAKRQAPNR